MRGTQTGHLRLNITSSEEAAQRRRALAVAGFTLLRENFERRGLMAQEEFYRMALTQPQPKLDGWHAVWEPGPLAMTRQTSDYLEGLRHGQVDHLLGGDIYGLEAPDEQRRLGVCGTLGIYQPEGMLL